MAVSKKMTKQSFRSWLEGYTRKTKVGYRTGKTPIEKFMEAQGITNSEMPKWAQTFTEEILNSSRAKSISASTALQTLDKVK